MTMQAPWHLNRCLAGTKPLITGSFDYNEQLNCVKLKHPILDLPESHWN